MSQRGSSAANVGWRLREFDRSMHARDLIELAALAACHGPALLRGKRGLSTVGVEQYWVASKCRLDRWGRAIKGFSQRAWGASDAPSRPEESVPAIIEEILGSEVLTRVWGALLAAWDQRQGQHECAPLGRSIYLGHLEARNRVLKLLVGSGQIPSRQAVQLNLLRQRTERWSDWLIGHLSLGGEVNNYAPHPDRAANLARDLQGNGEHDPHRASWSVLLASMRLAFRQAFIHDAANPDANARLATSVLSCFEPEAFDSTGLFPALWITRLESHVDDAQGLVTQLFRERDVDWFDSPSMVVDDPRSAGRLRFGPS